MLCSTYLAWPEMHPNRYKNTRESGLSIVSTENSSKQRGSLAAHRPRHLSKLTLLTAWSNGWASNSKLTADYWQNPCGTKNPRYGFVTPLKVDCIFFSFLMRQISSIQISMDLLKQTSSAISKKSHPQLYMKLWRSIILGLTTPPSIMDGSKNTVSTSINSDVYTHFLDTWLNSFDDIRWFMLRGLTWVAA